MACILIAFSSNLLVLIHLLMSLMHEIKLFCDIGEFVSRVFLNIASVYKWRRQIVRLWQAMLTDRLLLCSILQKSETIKLCADRLYNYFRFITDCYFCRNYLPPVLVVYVLVSNNWPIAMNAETDCTIAIWLSGRKLKWKYLQNWPMNSSEVFIEARTRNAKSST